MRKIRTFLVLITLAFILWDCERFVQPDGDTNISTFDEDESHYNNQDCMDCHYSAGRGEGWFTLAGTLNGANHRATVELRTGPDGTGQLVQRVEVDKHGNFYTTETIDYLDGLHVSIVDQNGNRESMDDKILSGGCSLCHGATTERLEID